VVIARLIKSFTDGLSDIRRDRLVDHLARIFVDYGRSELAEELLESFAVRPPRADSS
jgi:hypothetical protein